MQRNKLEYNIEVVKHRLLPLSLGALIKWVNLNGEGKYSIKITKLGKDLTKEDDS